MKSKLLSTTIFVLSIAGCSSGPSGIESIDEVTQAASTQGQYAYAFDPSGLSTSVGTGSASYAITRTGNTLAAGSSVYRLDALGRVISIDDLSITYGPDGQLAAANRGAQSVSYLYDESGQRLLKTTNGVPTAAYVDGAYVTATELDEPVRMGNKLLGILRNGQFVLAAADALGTVEADSNGTPHLASPFGARPVHPDVAAVSDYVESAFDTDLGTLRMGVRDYDPRIARFLQPDPLFLSQPDKCVGSPGECNLYSYALDRPLDYVDPTGTCSAPEGLAAGQAGICIEAFIASKWLPGTPIPALGDNRTFAADNPNLTARVMVQIIVDPKTGTATMTWSAAKSSLFVEGFGLYGRSSAANSNATKFHDGRMTFTTRMTAKNGFYGLPFAPTGIINAKVNFTVTPDGKVGLAAGGQAKAYPSYGIYSYSTDGTTTKSTRLYETPEGDISSLEGPMTKDIPAVKPGESGERVP